MAGEYGVGIAYKGLTMHKAKRWHTVTGKGLCAVMWPENPLQQQHNKMTTEGNFVQPAIPRYNGHYDHWSMLMENFLRSKEMWELVETGYSEASGSTQTEAQQKKNDEMKLKDLKVLGLVQG